MDVNGTCLARTASWVAMLFLGAIGAATTANAAVSVRVDARPVSDPIEAFVSVTDANNRPVAGLSAADFTLLVDGTAVASPNFSLPPAQGTSRVSVVFAMDMSQTVQQAALDPMRAAVTEFIDSMVAGDYAAIVKFNNTNAQKASVVQGWTQIDDGGTGDSTLTSAANAPYQGSGSNILDGVALSIDQIRTPSLALPAGPKAVVLISDGRDNASATNLATVLGSANAGSVTVFTIGVGNVGGTLLQDLAAGTGGEYLAAPDAAQIAAAYQRISNMLRNEYLLTFTSPITDCNSHSLETRVTGQTAVTSTFSRCDPPTGGGGGGGGDSGGGGGGGGGALGWFEIFAGLALVAVAHRGVRRRMRA
jgi:Predicted membrane protein